MEAERHGKEETGEGLMVVGYRCLERFRKRTDKQGLLPAARPGYAYFSVSTLKDERPRRYCDIYLWPFPASHSSYPKSLHALSRGPHVSYVKND